MVLHINPSAWTSSTFLPEFDTVAKTSSTCPVHAWHLWYFRKGNITHAAGVRGPCGATHSPPLRQADTARQQFLKDDRACAEFNITGVVTWPRADDGQEETNWMSGLQLQSFIHTAVLNENVTVQYTNYQEQDLKTSEFVEFKLLRSTNTKNINIISAPKTQFRQKALIVSVLKYKPLWVLIMGFSSTNMTTQLRCYREDGNEGIRKATDCD